jgi:type I restriction enzyme R subunit
VTENYQSEDELERELVHDLENQGYEYVPGLNIPEKMLGNVRVQLQALNGVEFLDVLSIVFHYAPPSLKLNNWSR